MAEGVAYRVPDSEWEPAAWIMGVSTVVRHLLSWCGIVLLFLGVIGASQEWWMLLLAFGLVFLSILLHELGHAVAAVLGGATLVRLQAGPVQLHALRNGWRVRWKRGPREFAGMVQSFPSPHRPLRRQMMVTVAAGPLVNGLLALGSLGLGYALRHHPAGAVLLGVGGYNTTLALANLLPWSSGMYASDGLLLWRWIRGIDHDDPQVAFTMLNARLLSGERFGAWADEYLRTLARSSQPGPMFVLWTRMKARQIEGEWARVDEVMREVELHIIGLSPPLAKALEGFIAVLRCEAAFSRAMAGEVLTQLDILGPDMGWIFPALALRCEALACALDGRPEQALARLTESAAWSRRSIDRSLEHGEVVLRQAVQARIDVAQTPASTPPPPRVNPTPVVA